MRTVYKLLDKDGKLLHIGDTGNDLRKRFKAHKYGKFPNAEIILPLESGDWTKKESYAVQCLWQKKYGLVTDQEKNKESAKLGGKAQPSSVKSSNFKRAAKKTNAMRVTCDICGEFTSSPGAVGNHKKVCIRVTQQS